MFLSISPNDDQIVAGLNRVLKPGGRLVLTVPAHMSLWSYFDIAARHRRRYSARALSRLLSESGFEVEYQTQFMAVLFLLIMVSRKLHGGRSDDDPDIAAEKAERELKIVPIINPLLRSVLSTEAWMVKRRWRLPIGTSHLAVARKIRPMNPSGNDQPSEE